MRKLLLLSLILVLNHTSFCQINFDGKAIANYVPKNNFRDKFYHQVDSLFKLDKRYDFEFRLWLNQSIIQDTKLFILSNYNGKFRARCFKYVVTSVNKIQEIDFTNEGADSLWSNLIKNKLLSLPPQDSIESKMVRYTTDINNFENQPVKNIGISDCDSYDFEIFTKDKFRVFEYYCPKIYLEKYSHIEELYRAFIMISLVKQFVGISPFAPRLSE